MHERREVEGWVSIQRHLIVEQLVRRLRWNACTRQGVLRNVLRILVTAPRLMEDAFGLVGEMLPVRVVFGLLNHGVGVD